MPIVDWQPDHMTSLTDKIEGSSTASALSERTCPRILRLELERGAFTGKFSLISYFLSSVTESVKF